MLFHRYTPAIVAEASFEADKIMLKWALIFFIVALVAGVLGFGGIAGASAGIAQILFWVFVVLFVIGLVMSLLRKAT